jgi:hypothetical protein
LQAVQRNEIPKQRICLGLRKLKKHVGDVPLPRCIIDRRREGLWGERANRRRGSFSDEREGRIVDAIGIILTISEREFLSPCKILLCGSVSERSVRVCEGREISFFFFFFSFSFSFF